MKLFAAHGPIPSSPAFEVFARGAQFRNRVAVRVNASPESIFRAAREVTLSEMALARLLGEIRYLPSRLAGHQPAGDRQKPFLSILTEGGTLILRDSAREIITGSAGRFHRIVDQAPVHFESHEAFQAFDDPDHEKLFMSLRVAPAGVPGQYWLVLEYATRALSAAAERTFRCYWLVIGPGGAFVSRQLLKAIRHRAQCGAVPTSMVGTRHVFPGRSVRATSVEATRSLPGDELITRPRGALTHAIAIRRPPRDVWPWLAQMGAGSRAGWYSYDVLDNARQASADRIIPALGHLSVGMIFPALPGMTDGFTVLAFEPERFLIIGWLPREGGTPLMTWAFVLEETEHRSTRLIVRVRAGAGYEFHGLPWWASRRIVPIIHFVMQRKQLLGIAARAESCAIGTRGPSTPASAGKRNAA